MDRYTRGFLPVMNGFKTRLRVKAFFFFFFLVVVSMDTTLEKGRRQGPVGRLQALEAVDTT